MNLIDALIQELESEAKGSRAAVERAPEDKYGWKPHEKSMSLGRLTGHIAEMPSWAGLALNRDEIDLRSGEFKSYTATSKSALLEFFDNNVAEATAAMNGKSNEELMQPWRLKVDGEVKMEMPRLAVIRSMVLNHIVHHRGQLTVYLRLLGVPVPSIYGPSADEGTM